MKPYVLIRIPVFCYFPVLDTEHVEPERLVMLTVVARPRLPHINDNHVVFADDIQ